ncbi:MAG: zinc-binding dehydrogenase [Deltaproteobacteria bacterium]|nr:zinc-binding dehydrogenase [Deltaproteobacteria bacterium]
MKAVVFHQHGGPEVLQYEDVPDPRPGCGEVLVRIKAVALNRLDLWVRNGLPKLRLAWPHILGSDIAGVVEAVGDGVGGVEVGKPVLLQPALSCGRCRMCLDGRDNLCRQYAILGENTRGGYAERIAVPATSLLPYPEGLDFEHAACLPLTFLTAWQMVVRRAEVRAGEWVLVHAAGSGVGAAAIQIAKLHGATVVTTVGSADKVEKARALGADHVILYRERDFAEEVRTLTGKRGVDVVIEHIGPATFAGSLRSLAWGGRLVLCGSSSGPTAEVSLVDVFFRQLRILGSTMGSKADLFAVLDHVRAGRLRPVLDAVLPLSRAREAHERLEARGQFGKIVLVP